MKRYKVLVNDPIYFYSTNESSEEAIKTIEENIAKLGIQVARAYLDCGYGDEETYKDEGPHVVRVIEVKDNEDLYKMPETKTWNIGD